MRQWKTVRGGSSSEFIASASQYIAGVRSSLPSRYVAPRSFRRLVPLASAATGSWWCRRCEVQRGLGLGCQVTSCTQSRLLRAELFVKGSRHRLSTIVRVVLIGRELVQFQHEKPFDCVNLLFASCTQESVRPLAVDVVIQLCRTRPTDAILADTIFIGTSSPFRHLNSRERAAVSC